MRRYFIIILLSILGMFANAQSVERTFLGCTLGETTWEEAQQILNRKSLEFDADSENSVIFVEKTSFYCEKCEPTLFFYKGTFHEVAFTFDGDVTERLRAKLFEDYPYWPKMGGGSLFFDLDTRILFGEDGGTKLFYTDLKLNAEKAAEEREAKTGIKEDELGYAAPTSDKPFKAYEQVKDRQTWNDVPNNWKNKMKIIFSEFADKL